MVMRVNIYAEEMTDRVELVTKNIDGNEYVAVRFFLYLPTTVVDPAKGIHNVQGPFMHRDGDDDSAAVTFWGKQESLLCFAKAIGLIAAHYRMAFSDVMSLVGHFAWNLPVTGEGELGHGRNQAEPYDKWAEGIKAVSEKAWREYFARMHAGWHQTDGGGVDEGTATTYGTTESGRDDERGKPEDNTGGGASPVE